MILMMILVLVELQIWADVMLTGCAANDALMLQGVLPVAVSADDLCERCREMLALQNIINCKQNFNS